MTTGSIDILLSTFNGGHYVASAIESVLGQTYRDFRLYIVDDCSSDDTWATIQRYEDPRITRLLNKSNVGLFANLNMLVSMSSSRWIKLLGQDDLLLPDCLERGLHFGHAHPSLGCFWCYGDSIDENGAIFARPTRDDLTSVLSTAEADRDCLQWGCLSANISNLFIHREALAAVGLFRADIMSADFDMMSRIQAAYGVGRFTDVLVQVRGHKAQWSRDIKQMENCLSGNMEVFARILTRAVEEARSLSREEATRLLNYRLATNEFNWLLKALQSNKDVGAAYRCAGYINNVVPLRAVAATWTRVMLPRYLRRSAPITKMPPPLK